MDELDVRICRALNTNRDLFPYSTPLKYSLREVARKLQVDHLTVINRFKRLQDKGFLSGWKVLPNPSLFGYKMTHLLIETPPKSPKEDMIRKLRLIHGVVLLMDYMGNSLGINLFYDSDQSLSRTIELISRITNAENVIQFAIAFPPSKTHQLTDTDWAIIRSLENDGLKSYVQVAKEIEFTPRTVKNRLQRLELESALMILPTFDIASIDGMIGAFLYYSYADQGMKSTVDRAALSHFEGSYLWATVSDPERACLILVAPAMSSIKPYLEWMKQQPGVASAEILIVLEGINLWSKASELFRRRSVLDQESRERLK